MIGARFTTVKRAYAAPSSPSPSRLVSLAVRDGLKVVRAPRGEAEPRKKDRGRSTSEYRALLLDLGRKLGIKESSHSDYVKWYSVKNSDILKLKGGSSLLQHFRSSLSRALRATLPEFEWDDSKFEHKPRNYWDSKKRRLDFLTDLAGKLGIKPGDFEGWYKVTWRDFVSHGGSTLLHRSGDSLHKLLSEAYSDHEFEESKFLNKPRKINPDLGKDLKGLMTECGKKLGISGDESSLALWYNISAGDLGKVGGTPIISQYGNSMLKVLTAIFPERKWEASLFVKRPKNFWDSLENQRDFMLDLIAKMGLKDRSFDSYYFVSLKDISKYGGLRLIWRYQNSPLSLFRTLFPEHSWVPWNFSHFESAWLWRDPVSQMDILHYLENELHVKEIGDWKRVTPIQLRALGVSHILTNEKKLQRLLRAKPSS